MIFASLACVPFLTGRAAGPPRGKSRQSFRLEEGGDRGVASSALQGQDV
jgi:hypothetical protein